jgi:ABC-type Na+ transport system ATPase subunit NatA
VVVLHNGRVLAKGAISSVVAAARTPDIGSAFTKLTQTEIDNAAEAGS